MSSRVSVRDDAVVIREIVCRDPSVVEYFAEAGDAQRPELVRRALTLGVAGLRSMNARADVDAVERGFERLLGEFQRAFDPDRTTSYLGRLTGYLGESGPVAAAVADNGAQVVKQILEQIAQLRDAVVGSAAAAAEREKGTAKGTDFEHEVEAVLCRVARAYGDTVTNVATEAGDDGRSKKGDFVVELAEGPRIAVESKNRTTGITLRGRGGILAALDESMVNRGAGFAIAVSKCADALPGEVGSFNAYDDKVVCAFGDDGGMLEVAYRWARVTLLAGLDEAEGDVDVDAVRSSLADVGSALDEIAKIKAKAGTIARTANEIQGLAEWQVARAKQSLAQAEQALDGTAQRDAKAS